MARKLEKMKITVGTGLTAKDYFFRSPNVYDAINAETGVNKAASTDRDEPETTVGQLLATGKVQRVHVTYEELGKRKTGKILMADNLPIDGVIGKLYNGDGIGGGGTITSARVPRRAFFS